MADKRETSFDRGIQTLNRLITDSSTDDEALKKFAESSESEEVIHNVMRIAGHRLSAGSKEKLILAGRYRMEYLKGKFEPGGGGRNMVGKMEYDTIKGEIEDLLSG